MLTQPEHELPAVSDHEGWQQVSTVIGRLRKYLFPHLPGETLSDDEFLQLAGSLIRWRNLHAPRFDLTPLRDCREILLQRGRIAVGQPASWTPTPSEFQAAAQKTAAALDEIEKWLKHA